MRQSVIFSLLFFACFICRGEHLFVGIMETEDYKSLELSISAFANASRTPEIKELLPEKGAQLTALPVFSGFDRNKRIRIIQTIDPDEPLSDINPANIAILPIIDGGKAIEKILKTTYKSRSYWRSDINIYENPSSTKNFNLVAVAKAGRYLLTSRSKGALLWAIKHTKLINAAPLKQKGALKFLINPQRTAAVINAKANPTLLPIFKPIEILQELKMCTLAITIDNQRLTVTADATPLAGTPLTTLAKNLNKPDESLLNSVPPGAFLSSISKCTEPEIWNRFSLNLQDYVVPAFTALNQRALFTGERMQYLAPTPDRKGLVFVQVETIKDAVNLQRSITKLDKLMPQDSQVVLKKITPPKDSSVTSYEVHIKKDDKKSETYAIKAIASLFIEHANLELTIKEDKLITVLGRSGSIKAVIEGMPGSPRNLSLLKEIHIRNDDLDESILTGTKLQLSKLVRFTASIIPNITKQQLDILPLGGYGSTFGLSKKRTGSIKASFQISADEIHALKSIGTDGRELMQKLLISMLMKRIEKVNESSKEKDDSEEKAG